MKTFYFALCVLSLSVQLAYSHPESCINSLGNTIQLTSKNTNDEYCDCDIDGADEDLTSACSFVDNTKFICINKDDISKTIHSSMICDCCDGSDEKEGICQDECHIIREQRLSKVRAELQIAEEGNRIMKERCEKGANKDDFSSLAREVRIAKRELSDVATQIRHRYARSRQIDKKYALFRNRYILRTGEIPEMDLLKKPYTDVSFLMKKEEEEREDDYSEVEEEVKEGEEEVKEAEGEEEVKEAEGEEEVKEGEVEEVKEGEEEVKEGETEEVKEGEEEVKEVEEDVKEVETEEVKEAEIVEDVKEAEVEDMNEVEVSNSSEMEMAIEPDGEIRSEDILDDYPYEDHDEYEEHNDYPDDYYDDYHDYDDDLPPNYQEEDEDEDDVDQEFDQHFAFTLTFKKIHAEDIHTIDINNEFINKIMNAKIEFANSAQSIKVREFILLQQQYNASYLLVPNNFKEMDGFNMAFINMAGMLFYPIRGFYSFLHSSSVKNYHPSHDEELKYLSTFVNMPYNSTLKYIAQVAYHSPDMLYHYHFITKKHVEKSVETRLYGMLLGRVKQAQKELGEVEQKIKDELKEYPPTVQCLISQRDECTTKQFGQYKYSVCIGGQAKQDNVKLGEWKLDVNYDYGKNSTIEYTGGTRCWNGIERKLIAKYECGKKEEIVSISEPSTCQYEAVVKSPCFCSDDLLDSIREKLA